MWLFYVAPVVALFVMMALVGGNSLDDLRDNWAEYRCHPMYIPFAGFIRDDVSVNENFMYCTASMANQIFKPILDVLNYLFLQVNESIGEIAGPIKSFRELFTRIRKVMLGFGSTVFSKITASTGVFTHYLIKIQDILRRFVSQGYIATFLVQTGINFIMSFVTLCISVIKTFVYIMLAIAIFLAIGNPLLLVGVIYLASMIGSSGF